MPVEKGKLTICSTPIGNLGDVTMRVLDALRTADVICAEDTRVTSRLLAAYGIEKRIERLDEAAISRQLERIVERLQHGEVIAYCTDAGMPGVSDPGLRLVRAAQDAGVELEVLPGASAGVTAYVASGFTNQRFYFGGFLPRKEKEASQLLESLKMLDAVLIFYESPARVVASLKTILEVFPLREVAVCRELTKLHEEVVRARAQEVYDVFFDRSKKTSIKGEIVIVIDSASGAECETLERDNELAAQARVSTLKKEGIHSNKDIIAIIQRDFSIPRNIAYEMVVGKV